MPPKDFFIRLKERLIQEEIEENPDVKAIIDKIGYDAYIEQKEIKKIKAQIKSENQQILEENKHEYPLFISTFLNVKLFHFSWLFIPMSVYISFLLRFSFGALLGPIWKSLFLAFSEQSLFQGMQLLIYLLFIFSPFIALYFLFKALSVNSTFSYNTNNILIILLGIVLPVATYFIF